MSKITGAELEARLAAMPRVKLAMLPTALEPAPRLSAALGGPEIWIKRDDMTGLCFGGNKTRQLDYVFADILKQGCDTVVAGTYTQSNWCRQMTAAAKKLGLDISLVLLHGEKGPALQGNFLLFKLMGADVTVIDLPSLEQIAPHLEAKAEALRKAGRKPYVVAPMDLKGLALGAVGYVQAAAELDAQLEAQGLEVDWVALAGANMTPAGMALGLKALGRQVRILNIAPIKWSEDRAVDIARIGNAAADLLGIETRLEPSDVENHDEYIGPRYGVMTDGCREALRLVAGTEGLILDPVYSGKAMAGLIDRIRKGHIRKGQRVVYVHTGGMPALFAYAGDLGLAA
ncbi:MAG: D-cysteine desulfhydrase family protein [Geminicoccaceae bacterium]